MGAAAGDRPHYRLVRAGSSARAFAPSAEQRAVIDHRAGRLRVLAGPGTGKTATIVEAVAERVLQRGADPASILVLTFSRRAAAELRDRISARLEMTVGDPLVRTLHSYAYAIVRAAALAAGEPSPRLLEAGATDLMVRELLDGQIERDGGAAWPAELRPALPMAAFASELRELLLRTAERGIGPARMRALARERGRPEWRAAATFAAEYSRVSDLRAGAEALGVALDQAALTVAALERLEDPQVLAAEQARVRRIFVDEYQDVDPAQARLIAALASGAEELVMVGDPDQSIYAFRGSQPGVLERVRADDTVALTTSYRMSPVLLEATRRLAAGIPGQAAHRNLTAAGSHLAGRLDVRTLPSAAREAGFIADVLHRAHRERQVPYSQMAVLLRSPKHAAGPIRRALSAAGIPIATGPAIALASDPLVTALLGVLRAGTKPDSLDGTMAMALISSPLGGMDPLRLRRLRRAVRLARTREGREGDRTASPDLLAAILRGSRPVPDGLPPDLHAPLRRMIDLVGIARAGAAEPTAEQVLWQIWQRSGLASQLERLRAGSGADRDRADALLDAVVALFDRAAELADQLPGAGIPALLEAVGGEQLPRTTVLRQDADAVSVLSAHAAKGLEWDLVVVAGVQQESWPDLRPRSGLLGLQALLDAADGIATQVPAVGALADERRLFYVACTRAGRHLVVTAVDDDQAEPSAFLVALAGSAGITEGWPITAHGTPRRALQFPALVAELRTAVERVSATTGPGRASPDPDDAARAQGAAAVLAELARAGITSADPAGWHGLAAPSTTAPRIAPGVEVRLSPSQIETLLQCPLRGVLQRHGGSEAPTGSSLVGVLVHALAEGMADGVDDAALDGIVDEFLTGQEQLPPWQMASLRRSIDQMRSALRLWMEQHAADRRLIGAELEIDVILRDPAGQATSGDHPVRLHGRVDRLSLDEQGRVVITDFKTGRSVISRADAATHAQLAAYQVAGALGAFDDAAGPAVAPGGAELVFLRGGKPAVRSQLPQTAAEIGHWLDELRRTAEDATGASLTARIGDYCRHCPVRSSCPLQPEGRQITEWEQPR